MSRARGMWRAWRLQELHGAARPGFEGMVVLLVGQAVQGITLRHARSELPDLPGGHVLGKAGCL